MYDTFATDRLIDLWLTEDIGAFDLTAQTMIEASEEADFHMNAREPMTVSGIAVAARVFQRYDPTLRVKVLVADGQRAEKGAILLEVSGSARSMLTAERTALNIVQRLSGIATETARYVDAIAGTTADGIRPARCIRSCPIDLRTRCCAETAKVTAHRAPSEGRGTFSITGIAV